MPIDSTNRGPGLELLDPAEPLYDTERTAVFRASLADSSRRLICKRPLGAGAMRRLRHEAAILTRLAGVAGVPQTVAGGNTAMITMVDLGGAPLADLLRDGPLPPERLVDTAIRLAAVLADVHGRGVVHKDINPANVVVGGCADELQLIDFDLATTFAEERPSFGHQNEIAGTLPYLAPEQTGRTGWPVDQRADLYAVGATMYEMATGEPPFGRGELTQLVHDHLARVPVSPAVRNPVVPEDLARIILRLLEKEPDKRYQSADGLLYDLTRLRDSLGAPNNAGFPLGERDFPLRLVPPSRLVGRDAELEQLQAALAGVTAGHGRGLLVTGPPGVGKTALIDQLRLSVTAAGGWFVTGKFDQYRQDGESDAVTQALRGLGRLLLAEPPAELAGHRTRLTELLGTSAGLIAAMLPEFASILEVRPADLASDGNGEDQGMLIQAGLALLRAVATQDRPVVMVLDDLQWAASTSIALLDAAMLADDLPGLLLVGAYRDHEIDAGHPLATTLARWERLGATPAVLRLRNLPSDDLATLLAEMLRLPAAEAAALAAAVGPRTSGNPFDTVELINAMRADGTLVSGPDGWIWNPAAIRRYVGRSDVLDLLATRIDRLPERSRTLLEIMASLGGQISLDLLAAGAGWSPAEVEEGLTPALEDGLLVLERDGGDSVRFRHDRVQQAAHHRCDSAQRQRLSLTLARRLVERPELAALAAEQYLTGAELVIDPDERHRVAVLMRAAATALQLINPVFAERLLAAAVALVAGPPSEAEVCGQSGPDSAVGPQADPRLLVALEVERHAVLSGLGRLDEADRLYERIGQLAPTRSELTRAACAQIGNLSNRNRQTEAVALGVEVLQMFGLAVPAGDELPMAIDRGLDGLQRWSEGEEGLAGDLARPAVTDPTVLAVGEVIDRMLPAAFFSGHPLFAWLVCQSQQLWAAHGPVAALVGPVGHACVATGAARGDFRSGYRIMRRVLAVGEARGYEPQTSQLRFLFALLSGHWFEPLEETVRQAVEARDGLQRRGDLQNACWTYYASLPQLLSSAPDLDAFSAEADAAVATANRAGNDQAHAAYLAYRQLARALRGETDAPGGFGDASLDEAAHFAQVAANPTGAGHAHGIRALSAAIFDDSAQLATHAAATMALLPFIPCTFNLALAHFLQGLALVQQAQRDEPGDRVAALAELEDLLSWLAARAADAPANFRPMVRLLEAERAWACGDGWAAARTFETALREVKARCRPWLRALITERAARCYLAYGIDQVGQALLTDAQHCYAEWGATGKVAELNRQYPFLRDASRRARGTATGGSTVTTVMGVASEAIDLLGVLTASQAISSETDLNRLRVRVGEVLGAMTGATAVQLLLRDDAAQDWYLPAATGDDDLTVAEAAARGLVPLSVVRYVGRTREALVVDDVACDDRFCRDAYFAGVDACSLLAVPILAQGAVRAMLLLENRLGRGAFTADCLSAVTMIAGQLAVSLDNALLYASLERKVAERTEALAAANAQLEQLAITDPLTGLANRRRLTDRLDTEWLRAQRPKTPLTVAMIDVDHFKGYNDHYGHAAGDECLRKVAAVLADAVRASDVVARYGGEEFTIVLPDTNLIQGGVVAERVRAAVEALEVPHAMASRGVVTVSIGIASVVPTGVGSAEDLIEAADAQLYHAKRGGRNRVASEPVDADDAESGGSPKD